MPLSGPPTAPPSALIRAPRPRLQVTPSGPLRGLEPRPPDCPHAASVGPSWALTQTPSSTPAPGWPCQVPALCSVSPPSLPPTRSLLGAHAPRTWGPRARPSSATPEHPSLARAAQNLRPSGPSVCVFTHVANCHQVPTDLGSARCCPPPAATPRQPSGLAKLRTGQEGLWPVPCPAALPDRGRLKAAAPGHRGPCRRRPHPMASLHKHPFCRPQPPGPPVLTWQSRSLGQLAPRVLAPMPLTGRGLGPRCPGAP